MDISLCGNRCLIALQVGVDWTSCKHPLDCNRALLASQVTADWNPGVGALSFLWSPAVSEEGVAWIGIVKFFPFLLTCVAVCFLKRLCACVRSLRRRHIGFRLLSGRRNLLFPWCPQCFLTEGHRAVSIVFYHALVLFLNEDLTEPAFIIIFTDEIKSLKL